MPTSPSDSAPLLADGVRSILSFIRRTAERDETGCGWTTIDYENKPHKAPSIFNGSGGISLLLVDAAPGYGAPGDADLAAQAVDWALARKGKHRRGIYTGKAGVALAALHHSAAVGRDVPHACLEMADILCSDHPGPYTDLMGGAASNGLYLVKLWNRTKDGAHLAGAVRCAEWLDSIVTRDGRGTHCPVDPTQKYRVFPMESSLGAAHGISGIGHFIVLLAEATRDERWAGFARQLLDTTFRYAMPIHGGLNWPVCIGRSAIQRCQWSHGSPGIGLAFFDGHRVLGEPQYLDAGLQAAEATYGYGDFRSNDTFCWGLAGQGELLFRAYQATGEARWKERATEFALRCLAYRESTAEGDAWPTDAKGLHSADYCCGAAGVGHFFLRLLSDGTIALPLY